MSQQVASYVKQLQAEMRRLGADREQTQRVTMEVYASIGRSPGGPAAMFGPVERFARDAVTGQRPLRIQYLQQLSLELSNRKVPGARIGQVLAEVDEHVTDSAEDPGMAFGPPGEYAARIAAEMGELPEQPTESLSRKLLTSFAMVMGTLLAVEGIVALIHRHAAPLTFGVLAAAVTVPLLEQGFGRLVRRPAPVGCLAALIALAGGLLVQAAVLMWFRDPVLVSLPAWAPTALGLALVAASVWLSRSPIQSAMLEPVTDPRPGKDAGNPAVWDDTYNQETVKRRIGWGVAAIAVLNIIGLMAVVLLFRP